MKANITPPNKTFYMQRVKAARDCLKHSDIMPPFLVVYMCYSVMFRALGSNAGVLRYVLGQWIGGVWGNVRERAWWTWHMMIRCRSNDEIQELIDRKLEKLTGEDHREWPDVVVEETDDAPLGFKN
jgi:hypothetical protein